MTAVALAPEGQLPPLARVSLTVPRVPSEPRRASALTAGLTTDWDPGDGDVLVAIAGGHQPALLVLYDRYGRIAYGLAYRILQEAGAAEEAVQDAFLRVWHRAATFDSARGRVRPWLLTIVHHCAIDLLRRRGGTAAAAVSLDALIERQSAADTWSEVSHRDEQERVRTAVASLPHAQRRAIELAYFEGLTHREIADRDGLPLGTVKGRMRLGLKRLAQLLADQD